MKTGIRLAAALAIGCGAVHHANAQQPVAYPPLLRDLPETATLPQGTFDVLGIHLGQKREDALARINALKPATPLQVVSQPIEVRDTRGNVVRFAYDRWVQARLIQADGTAEILTVTFTTSINGSRVDRIERYVMYAINAQANVPALVNDLNAKYGPASYERNLGSGLWIDRVWHEKKFIKLNEQVVKAQSAKRGTPASCIDADGGQYLFNVLQQNDWPGCTVHFKVEIQLGRSNALAANVKFTMVDLARWAENVRDTDAWVTGEMNKSASSKGTRSRL